MSPLFGRKKARDLPVGRTVLLVDIENGSVGAGLVHALANHQPRLFGGRRELVAPGMRLSGVQLSERIERTLASVLQALSRAASRVRSHRSAAHLGEVSSAVVVMAPPWGRPNLSRGRPDFLDSMTATSAREIARSFGYIPTKYFTNAGVVAYGTQALFGPQPMLLLSISAEVSELMRMDEEGVQAHATIPLGSHALLRTLMSHGGLSEAEARSAARMPFGNPRFGEPSTAHAKHYARELADVLRELMRPGEVARVRVVAAEPHGEWIAQALTETDVLHEFFPHGGEIRALRPHHLGEHVVAHGLDQDIALMLGALFVDREDIHK